MTRLSRLARWLLKILLSAGTVVLFSVLFLQVSSVLSLQVITLLYLVPVLVSAAFFGIAAGVTASLLSFLLYNYFFIPPYHTFHVARPQDFLSMFVLLGVAILISSLMARIQANLKKAEAREREAWHLSALSQDLTNQQDLEAIAHVLAGRLAKYFLSSTVVVEVTHADRTIHVQAPTDTIKKSSPPSVHLPLSSPRGLFGNIWIWMDQQTISPEEERLLQTFARQGALAFDRADLMEAQNQAKVIEESDKLKTAILSSVSHELRTPLASIQASATSLFNPNVNLEPDARDELQNLLLEEINRMIQLVGNLLNMSRIEARALKLQRQWNSFSEIVDLSIQSFRRFSANHKLVVDVSEDLPLVAVDSVLMEQVIINLIRNSLRHSPPGSVIGLNAKVDDQMMVVTVTNQGPPIPNEYLQHIFEKFYPIPGRDQSAGLGLGLSICKGVVEAHGGKIWAENMPSGVAFHFTISLVWEGTRPVVPDKESEDV